MYNLQIEALCDGLNSAPKTLCKYHKGMKEVYNAVVKKRRIDTKSSSGLKKVMIHELGYSAYLCWT